MFPNLLRLWTGPLPHQELFPDRPVNPFVQWFIHPVRRWLAKFYILFLQKNFGLRVIAITGSTGKTTTKDMLYSILIKISPAVITSDNGNPTYSIPQAILKCLPSTRFLILEMGVEYPGDMHFYTWLVTPDIGILTGISYTHTAFFGTLERLAAEKISLLSASPLAVSPADDPNSKLGFPSYTFGRSANCFTRIVSSVITSQLTTQIQLVTNGQSLSAELPALGTHFALPAAAAATVATLVDVHPQIIAHGLKTYIPSPHRLIPVTLPSGALLLDDTHNANPAATQASLEVLVQVTRLTRRSPVIVFAQMDELGQYEQSAHQQVGLEIKKLDIRNLLCLGPATLFTLKSAGFGQYFETLDSLTAAVRDLISSQTSSSGTCNLVILVKGSHSWHLENLVSALLLGRN